jgi:hypothetical protein
VTNDFIVEERHWSSGVEIISHVNHSHLARVRTVLESTVSWGSFFSARLAWINRKRWWKRATGLVDVASGGPRIVGKRAAV